MENQNELIELSGVDTQKLIDRLNRKRECGRNRGKKWYDAHSEELKQKRLEAKLAKKAEKATKETAKPIRNPEDGNIKRGRKIKPVEVKDILHLIKQKIQN